MATSDSNFYNGHRERLRQKFLDDKLAEYEKLELMLGYVVPRRDMRPLAHALIKKFGSIGQVLTASYQDLTSFPGVGKNIAIFLKLVHQIVLDGYKTAMDTRPIFHDINILKNYCKWSLANKQIEEFHVLYLDSEYKLLQDETHSRGTFNTSSVYVREIVKHALALNATGIVLVHNHPTTDQTFSSTDIHTTEEIKNLLESLDIKLYDHLLVSKCSIYSARDIGFLQD